MFTLLLIFTIIFFFNDPAPTEIYPLPLRDALPILEAKTGQGPGGYGGPAAPDGFIAGRTAGPSTYSLRMADTPKPYSHEVTDGRGRAPARAMLRAVGMTDADWGSSQVGVASSWNEVTPANMPLHRLAKRPKLRVR